jgi:hypothetical protein
MDSNDLTTDNPVLVWVSETVTPVKGIRQLTYVSARLLKPPMPEGGENLFNYNYNICISLVLLFHRSSPLL